MEISEGQARRFVTDVLGTAEPLSGVSEPSVAAAVRLPEVQNAIRAARESADSAIAVAVITNRLFKLAWGKSPNGLWSPEAVDSLRASLMFASAGLDTSLKRLVASAMPELCEKDPTVETLFNKWAERYLGNTQTGAVKASELVRLLVNAEATPRDALMSAYIYELTSGSAQSVERVSELSTALGVTQKSLRKRFSLSANGGLLKAAFFARNEIAHEMDVTKPESELRRPLEKIRAYRRRVDIAKWCAELLDVTQLITNDVAERLA